MGKPRAVLRGGGRSHEAHSHRAGAARAAAKRGDNSEHDPLTDSIIEITVSNDELFAVHDALDALAAEDARAADLVKLRFFVGMGMEQAATALDLPLRAAERLWTFARARLRSLITEAR